MYKSKAKSRMRLKLNPLIICVFLFCFTAKLCGQETVDFAHDILPVLQEKCAKCHSNNVYKGGLSLESRADLLNSGTVEIGARKESDLFERIVSDDPDYRMPPQGVRLSATEIANIGRWIDGKLEWPESLSLKPKTYRRPLDLRRVQLPDDPQTVVAPMHHPIDQLVESYFQEHSVVHPPRLTPEQFLRRAKLDLLGQVPTPEELKQFSAQANSESAMTHSKSQLVDELLSRNREYADHWMSFWNDLLRNDYVGTGYIDGGRKQITRWLHRSLMENKPYDQFVSELINPEGESAGFIKGIKWRGRVNASQIEPLQFSQNISQVFLGINMKCASCHDSFIDDWKLEDAYGLAAIISDKPLMMHRCDVPTGELATSKFVFPQLGEIDQSLPPKERLARLAELIVSKQNGRLPRTLVNRIWHRMMGRGLVHPVDVMANEAWSETILDFLAMDLVDHGYDLKRTFNLIATSKIYASQSVTSESAKANVSQSFVFRGVLPKRMTAEQWVDAVWTVTDTAPVKIDAGIQLKSTWHSLASGKPASAKWIWSDGSALSAPGGQVVTFRYEFELAEMPTSASAVATCDNEFRLWLNGKPVGKGDQWNQPEFLDLMKRIRVGRNELLVRAINGSNSPNPAAFFFQANISRGENLPDLKIQSDETWQCVVEKLDPNEIPEGLIWKPAVEVAGAVKTYAAARESIEGLVARLTSGVSIQPRASLVKSNDLMRSLGRPNREQVVTTRPAELSTLQALDLSNGEMLASWLNQGAPRWVARQKENQWSDQELISNLFVSALSRQPTAKEIELLLPTKLNQIDPEEWVSDLLWMIFMLPDFQFVK